MTSSSFPDCDILALPLTMQAAVIKNLGPAESLKIATNNKDFRKVLSTHKLHATSLYYKWETDPWDGRVYIEVDFGENTSKFWICVPFDTPWTLKTGTEKRQEPLEIGDIVFQLKEFKEVDGRYHNPPIMCLESDRILPGVTESDVFDMYTSFLMNLIKVDKVKVWGGFSEDNDFLNSFLWKHHREISEIISDLENKETLLENFKFFNEQLAVEKFILTFRGKVFDEHRSAYITPITTPDVTLYEADFLHPDAILKSRSSLINLYDLPYSYSFMNAVVRTWMNGGLANLQKLRIMCAYRQSLVKDEEFLEGIVATRKDTENETHPTEGERKQFDVRRLTDGALATIQFDYKRDFMFWIQNPLEN